MTPPYGSGLGTIVYSSLDLFSARLASLLASRLEDLGTPVAASKTTTPTGEVSISVSWSARARRSSRWWRALVMARAALGGEERQRVLVLPGEPLLRVLVLQVEVVYPGILETDRTLRKLPSGSRGGPISGVRVIGD